MSEDYRRDVSAVSGLVTGDGRDQVRLADDTILDREVDSENYCVYAEVPDEAEEIEAPYILVDVVQPAEWATASGFVRHVRRVAHAAVADLRDDTDDTDDEPPARWSR